MHLGNTYRALGDYERAHILLKRVLPIYEKHYGKEHVQTAALLNYLGELYMSKDYIVAAENVINRAFSILKQTDHPERYISLEKLTELYLKKSTQEINKGNIQQARYFKNQSIDYLKQSLEIVKTYFPENSLHITRIQLKLKNLET